MDWIRQGNAKVEGDTITISKKDLQEIRDHYLSVADAKKPGRKDGSEWMWGFYLGKAEVLIEMLKAFDNNKVR